MAQSTALRQRYRQRPNPVVVIDSLGPPESIVSRVLPEDFAVTDSEVVTYRRLIDGDKITSFADSDSQFNTADRIQADSLAAEDSIVSERNTRKIIQEYAEGITDEGFITDRDILRYRGLPESLIVLDDFQKTITLADFQIINKVIQESIVVSDTVYSAIGGVIQRTLSDAISVEDYDLAESYLTKDDSLSASDASEFIRYRNRQNRTQNLLLQNEDLSAGPPWVVSGGSIDVDTANDQYGNAIMDRLNVSATLDNHNVYQATASGAGLTYALSAFFRNDGADYVWLNFTPGGSSPNNYITVIYDLTSGIVSRTVASGSGVIDDSGVVDYGGGLYSCWLTGSVDEPNCFFQAGTSNTRTPSTNTYGEVVYTGVEGEDVFIGSLLLYRDALDAFSLEYAAVTDDIIVGRNAIINTKTISDSFTLFDRIDANRIVVTKRSAKIKHGIENQ